MNLKIFTLQLLIICICVPGAFSQSSLTNPEIGIMGIYTQDSVLLRWAPTSLTAYERALSYGFSLERGVYAIDGEVLNQDSYEASIVLLDSLIVLIDEEDWDEVNVNSELKAAAVELLYNFQYTAPDIDSVNVFSAVEEEDNKKTLVAIASILADRDWDAATAMGWAFKDGTVDTGYQYVYILTSLHNGDKFHCVVSTENEFEFTNIPKPNAFPGDSIVRITFDKYGIEDYYGYYIQRSDDQGQTFNLVTDSPVYYEDERTPNLFSFVDTLPDNETVYIFRIAGVTPFGLQSEWSDTVSVQGIPGALDASPDILEIVESGTGVDIMFDFPTELENKIQGFEVIRSLDRSGPFLNLTDDLLSPTTREFHDDEPLHSNYYFVRAIDENGYPLLSIPTYYAPIDSIPPAIPIGLGGSIDASSNAHIHWTANSEFDIKGYKVFAANDSTSLFVEITRGTIQDTFYTYQLGTNVLNADWYVQVRSVDQNENESEISEPVLITRPDLFAPSAPVLKDLNAYAFGVAMNWVKSGSLDVVSHVLQRKEEASNTWTVILDITNEYQQPSLSKGWEGDLTPSLTEFNYIDSTVEARKVYQYRVLAYDGAGNVGSSAILGATGYDDGIRGEIYDLMAIDDPYTIYANTLYTTNQDKAGVVVGWNYTDSMTVHHFIIYRSADNWPYKAYQSYLVYEGRPNPSATTDNVVASSTSSGLNTTYVFLDKEVKPGTNYKYKIIAKHLDGGFSRMSDIVSVTTSN